MDKGESTELVSLNQSWVEDGDKIENQYLQWWLNLSSISKTKSPSLLGFSVQSTMWNCIDYTSIVFISWELFVVTLWNWYEIFHWWHFEVLSIIKLCTDCSKIHCWLDGVLKKEVNCLEKANKIKNILTAITQLTQFQLTIVLMIIRPRKNRQRTN